ncbi:MAG TPA: PIN domain-containing protein [Phycisphaerales bacterium]|nr:PIN domain-containing protein [Phycisphaerales bacterium]
MTSRVAVDTDVFSYMLKQDTRRARFERHLERAEPVLSAMVVAELYRWALIHKWGPRRQQALEDAIRRHIVVPLTPTTSRIWADVFVARNRMGRRIGESDCWIAATAIEFGIPLVTNNERDFANIANLTVLGPHGA